jgi:sorbitol-specific phosphotransferase system component IIC
MRNFSRGGGMNTFGLATLLIPLLVWALAIAGALWVLLTLARIRRALERIADSLAALAARGDELR